MEIPITRILTIGLFLALPAAAFDGPGHMQVADIAWVTLAASEATRLAIRNILKKGRGGFKLVGNDSDKARDAFDRAATFPDVIKGNTNSEYEPMIGPMNLLFWTASQAAAQGNEGKRCKSWHYLDTPLFVPPGVTPDLPTSNLAAAVTEGVLRLKQLKQGTYNGPTFPGLTNDDLKFWWLAWLLHLTGDAHQPLHCASAYNVPGNVGKPDAGGNKFMLGHGQKLHGLWDGALEAAAFGDGFSIGGAVNSSQPGNILGVVSDAWITNVPVTIGDPTNLSPTDWVKEGAAFAKTVAYVGIQAGQPPSNAYLTKAKKHSKQAAVLAGKRLAELLKSVLA